MDRNLVYTGEEYPDNWFWKRYYYCGSNSRYYTFQIALNLLHQRHSHPTIIETGCQRQEEDVGAGMSTSIFAEFINRYGGHLIAVDIVQEHLNRAKQYLQKWPNISVAFIPSDSISFLKWYTGTCDLIYLDSLDYPVAQDTGNIAMKNAAQEHCLKEFLAIEPRLNNKSIVLLDDNQLWGGGKPALTKEHLANNGWTCLLDLQSSIWVKEI
jgi:hypothetical protein